METLGFAGLGTMGGPMAGHLVKAGHDVTVWNRSAEKSAPLAEQGAKVAANLKELAEQATILFICVNRSEDVRAVVEGCLESARPGTLFVDHSTIAPEAAREIAALTRAKGCSLLDAPITGGSMGAKNGTLTIFCGGSETEYARVKPFLTAYAKRSELVGPSGAGQMMKLANQIAVGGALIGLCESLAFAKKAGLDIALARELIGGGAGGSWAFEFYGPKILSGDHSPGFSVKNQRKDFAYTEEAARALGAKVPGVELVDRLLAILEESGRGEEATTALYDVLLDS